MNTKRMYIMGIAIITLWVIIPFSAQAQQKSPDLFMHYIESPVLSLNLEQVETELAQYAEDNFENSEYSIYKALLLFRKALLSFTEESTLLAFEYWNTLYALTMYHNPIHLMYTGTLESMHGGAISSPEPIKKIAWTNRGIKKMQTGIEELQQNTENTHAAILAYAYFLQGSTYVQLPNFFKEFAQTPDSLRDSLKWFSKARKEAVIDEGLLLFLVAHTYNIFGDYYLKTGEVKKAKKYFSSALKYIKESKRQSPLEKEIADKLDVLG